LGRRVGAGGGAAALPAAGRKGPRGAPRERRLADAALPRHDAHDRANRLEPLPEPPLLGLHLARDVRAAVARDVLVALHAVSSAHAARAITRSAATVTIMNTIAPRRKVISPPHGAGTLAVSGRSATCSTCHARTAMNAARMRAKSRRERIQRSNHARRRARRYGTSTRKTSPTTIHA